MRITDFPELVTATGNDLLVTVDIANDLTKKIKLENLPTSIATTVALATKQNLLVSGTNIKTVNSTTLLGSGDIAVQPTLVSGTNIKTLNSVSLLGSGDIVVGATPSGVAGAIQFSDGSAFASDAANFFWDNTNKRLGVNTITPTAKIEIIGGATSGTFSLKIKKSDGTPLFQIRDDGLILIGNGVGSISTVSGTADLPAVSAYTSIYTGIGTKNASARMECDSTTQGFLPPRMTTTQRDAIATPATGLKIYNTTLGTTDTYDGATWQRFGKQTLIKGSGSTSATTSLLVQNSSASDLLKISDDGSVLFGIPSTIFTAFQLTSSVGRLQINTNDNSTYGTIIRSFNAAGTDSQKLSFWASGFNFETNGGLQVSNNATGAVASAILQADSTTKGFLPPRMTTTQKNAIASPLAGLQVYDTTTNKLCCYNGSTWNDLF